MDFSCTTNEICHWSTGFAQCAASEVKQHPAAQAVVTSVGQGRGRTGSSPWAGVAFGLASSLLSASVVSCEAASPGPDKVGLLVCLLGVLVRSDAVSTSRMGLPSIVRVSCTPPVGKATGLSLKSETCGCIAPR